MVDWLLLWNNLFSVAFNLVYISMIVSTIIVIILDNRNPVKTIAWVLILIFIPLVGIIFYFFFGKNIRRERMLSRSGYRQLENYPKKSYLANEATHNALRLSPVQQFFLRTNASFPFENNKIRFFTQGGDFLIDLLHTLQGAKHHIHMEYYIIEDDAVGRLIKDVLIDKAREGVEVRFLYDDVGCWRVPNAFFEGMREAGIEARAFMKVRFPLFTSKVNYRNHRKITVVDGKYGYVGGMNLALRYVRGVKWGVWRDTQMFISGRSVYGLQSTFLLDWYFSDRSLITASAYYPCIPAEGNITLQIATSEPIGEWKEIMQGLIMAITTAKKYFYIQTPYFLPSDTILYALQTVALAGVDVRVMLPKIYDNRLIGFASCSYVADLLRAGVKVYFYEKGFLHSKMMVSDNFFSTVGTTNMDFRSFEHNFEVNALIYNAVTAHQLKTIFLNDQKDCMSVEEQKWAARSRWQKGLESVIRLFAPLL